MNRKKIILMLAVVFLLISACAFSEAANVIPDAANTAVAPTVQAAGAGGSTPTGPQSAVTIPAAAGSSNAPTPAPPTHQAPSPGSSSNDAILPSLSNVDVSSNKVYYHDNGCGATTVTISARATDNSGSISQVWVDYQYLSMSAGVGGNQWFQTNLSPKGNDLYEGTIDATIGADGELQGNDGTLQYQVYAMDAAGNTRVVPDGFIYGITALPCFPQAQPPGGGSSDPITISNMVTYPQGAVYYGNCTTEETIFNLQATIDPLSKIASATMYYSYTGPGGTYGNYSTTMYQLGIGDYSGDIDVGAEASFGLGTDDGTLDAYISVIDIDGNSIDSNWVSLPVRYCGGTVGQPPPPPNSTIAKGSGPVYNNYSLDLGDGNGDDVIFSQTSSDGSQLLSVWGTELKVDLQADIEACKTSIDTGNTFGAISIDPQDIVCYKTGSGNYGYLIIDGFFLDLNDSSQSYVDISYETEVMP